MTRFPIDGTGRLASEREHPTTLLTGPASGDLAGNYPAPTVATVNGHAASSVVTDSRFVGPDNSWVPLSNYPQCVAINDTYVYFGVAGTGKIGRVKLDGSELNEDLFDVTHDEGYDTGIQAIQLSATHIYWTESVGRSMGRSLLDGTSVETPFLGTILGEPGALWSDATHIYWTWAEWTSHDPTLIHNGIGRANLDGTGRNDHFIDLPDTIQPTGLAGDATHLYFGCFDNDASTPVEASSIGRANLDGTGLNTHFIPQPVMGPEGQNPLSVAVAGGHIYWAWGAYAAGGGPIARANVDGSQVEFYFVGPGTLSISDAHVGGAYIYWASYDSLSLGRADLSSGGGQSYTLPNNNAGGLPLNPQTGRGRTLAPLKTTTFPNYADGNVSVGTLPLFLTPPALASYGFTESQAQTMIKLFPGIIADLANVHAVLTQLIADLTDQP